MSTGRANLFEVSKTPRADCSLKIFGNSGFLDTERSMERLRTHDVVSSFQRLVVEELKDETFFQILESEEVARTHKNDEKSEGSESNEHDDEEKSKTLTLEEKIEILQRQPKRCLQDEIKKWKRKRIERIFSRFVASSSKSKSSTYGLQVMKSSLTSLFYRVDENVNRRVEEYENLKNVDFSHHALFAQFKGIALPGEIIHHIISFVGGMGYSNWNLILMKLGRICRAFYFVIMKHWKKVTITPKNLYKIPLIVLHNVSEVTINRPFLESKHIRKFQSNYLFEQLGNVTHLNLNIGKVFKEQFQFFRHLQKYKDSGKRYPFDHVTRIIFPSRCRLNLAKTEMDWSGIRFKSLFPQGCVFHNIPSLFLLRDMDETVHQIIVNLNSAPMIRLIEAPQFGYIPSHCRFIRFNNTNFFVGDTVTNYAGGFLELIRFVQSRSKDIEMIVAESNTKHARQDMLKGKREIITYFGEDVRQEIQGDVEIKTKSIKNYEGYWGYRVDYICRIVWKRYKK